MNNLSVNLGVPFTPIPKILIEKGDIVAESENSDKMKVIRVTDTCFVCLQLKHPKRAVHIPKGSYLIKYP